MNEEQMIQGTTDILLSAVDEVLDRADAPPRFVQHALLAYEVIDENGQATFDYVVTNTLTLTNVIGVGDAIAADARRTLLGDE